MERKKLVLLVNDIKLPINASYKEAFSVARKKIKSLGLLSDDMRFSIYRRSVDARKRDNIFFVYSVSVETSGKLPDIDYLKAHGIGVVTDNTELDIRHGDIPLKNPPVVVGSGPAGMFCALLLAEEGYRPIVIERGGCIRDRLSAVRRFNESRVLDESTNIQFGGGGAGTFSDGKLVTRTNDPLISYFLRRLVDFGAPESIKYIAKPHVGTDVLSPIVDRILSRIEERSGRVLYNTTFISPILKGDAVVGVRTSAGDIPTDTLVLAIGHSARDTYFGLMDTGMTVEAKDFSVGMRIEHLTEDIDKALYGDFAGNPALGHAEYNLSYDTKNRGVYTFCMCPGGEVVAATSECGSVVVNGMSNNARYGKNSNSAVLASVFRSDYGGTPRSAIEFQRKIERSAYTAGGSDYSVPLITVGDFLSDRLSAEPKRVMPTYMGGAYKLCRPEEYLPRFATDSIKRALLSFDKKIFGFASADAILSGAETRTSAPIRILRDNETRLAIGYRNLYPAGEGAGYAGGITSAAVDGIKTAISIIGKYKI